MLVLGMHYDLCHERNISNRKYMLLCHMSAKFSFRLPVKLKVVKFSRFNSL